MRNYIARIIYNIYIHIFFAKEAIKNAKISTEFNLTSLDGKIELNHKSTTWVLSNHNCVFISGL
jgi:hypothetical protein